MAIRMLGLLMLAVLLGACDSGAAPPTIAQPTIAPTARPTIEVGLPSPTDVVLALPTATETPVPLPTLTPQPPTLVPVPTEPPTALPTAAPAIQDIDSGGLGLSIAKWEARHGASSGKGNLGMYYEANRYEVVAFDGPIDLIFVTYGDAFPVSVEDAKFIGSLLFPADATLVKAETIPDVGSTIYSEVYHSASLASVFDALPPQEGRGPWRGAKPGTFELRIRAYDSMDGRVPSFNVWLGQESP